MQGIELFRLDGRVALITGGSRGLGRSMAEGLASAGADLVLCSRTGEQAEGAAREISQASGCRALGLACDVRQEDQVLRVVERTVGEFGKVDILVNSAGVNIRGRIEDLSRDAFEEVLATNTTGTWLACRAVAPHMRRAGYGRVVNVASTLGAVGVGERTPYAASKGAVVMITRVLALEWAGEGITVNALCPGPFLTEMNHPIAEKPEAGKVILDEVPLGRWGELAEIQGAAIFLASDASSYVTGTCLFVDGGWTAH